MKAEYGIILLACLFSAVAITGCTMTTDNPSAALGMNEGYTTATVIKTIEDTHSEGSGDNLEVHTSYVVVTDKGNFEVDRLPLSTFDQSKNADTLYAMIQENHTYTFHHYGGRSDATYTYPIIVGVTPA